MSALTSEAPAEAPARDEDQGKKEKVVKIGYRSDTNLFPVPEGHEGDYIAPALSEPATPENFNSTIHKPLAKTDFENEIVFLEFKARGHDDKAAKCRSEIETIKKLGNAADRSKAKKLMAMQQRMAELAAELNQDGTVDLASILGADQAAALLGSGE